MKRWGYVCGSIVGGTDKTRDRAETEEGRALPQNVSFKTAMVPLTPSFGGSLCVAFVSIHCLGLRRSNPFWGCLVRFDLPGLPSAVEAQSRHLDLDQRKDLGPHSSELVASS